jgi:DNA-binding protein HU-beta
MNKQQLVDAVGERLGDRKTAATAVDAVLSTVSGALAEGERVSLFGFGVFEKVDRAARTARNPSTGGTVQVPATSVPRFRAGQALKDAVNGGSSRTAARRTTEVVEAPAPKAKDKAKDSTKKPKAKADDKKADKAKAKDKAGPKSKGKKK